MVTEEMLFHFADRCMGRRTDYASQLSHGRYVRVGAPVTLEVLIDHVSGKQTIGGYLMDEQGLCPCAVYDADSVDGLSVLLGVQQQLAASGIPAHLELSRRGGHLWVFFSSRVPSWLVRRWLLPYCPSGVEFYPKQEHSKGYGSLIRLPLGVHRLTGVWYPFVQCVEGQWFYAGPAIDDCLAFLLSCELAPVPDETLFDLQATRRTTTPIDNKKTSSALPAGLTIQSWCALQDPFEVIGRYVDLSDTGVGCCPFPWHHASETDRHPSFKVYRPSRPGGCCWHCYTWGQGGNVFNFLSHYYHLEAKALWRAILTGEL